MHLLRYSCHIAKDQLFCMERDVHSILQNSLANWKRFLFETQSTAGGQVKTPMAASRLTKKQSKNISSFFFLECIICKTLQPLFQKHFWMNRKGHKAPLLNH